jgi:hypothetical protein
MFPLLGPEIIKWLLDRGAQPEDRLNSSFMDELISGPGTDNESAHFGIRKKPEEE